MRIKNYIWWNGFEALCAQALLVLTTIFIRTHTSGHIHGSWATIVALFYMASNVLDFGFSASIAPFFLNLQKNKKNILFFIQSAARTHSFSVLLGSLCILFTLFPYIPQHSLGLAVLCSCGVVAECAHKSLRKYLQLCGHVRYTALTEVFGIASFFTMTLVCWYTNKLSLAILLLFLVVCITAQTLLLAVKAYQNYQKTPNGYYCMPKNFSRRFVYSRIYTGLNQVSKQLFSSNFLIPVFAFIAGTQQASTLKIIASITMWISIIIEKTIGTSSTIAFAQTKEQPYTKKTIKHIMQKAWIYCASACLLCISAPVYATLQKDLPYSFKFLICALLSLTFLESFITVYTKRCIIEEKAYIPLICSLISCSAFLCTYLHSTNTIVYSMLAIRTCALLIMVYLSQRPTRTT